MANRHRYQLYYLLSAQLRHGHTGKIKLSCLSLILYSFTSKVALTSPDPAFNSDAKEYFERHMRILETCIDACPMQDMQTQVHSLRLAFSADITKPFMLKPNFPVLPGSNTIRVTASPPLDARPGFHRQTSHVHTQSLPYNLNPSMPVTPISAGPPPDDLRRGPMVVTSLAMMTSGQRAVATPISSALVGDDSASWNPTPIFEYGAKFPTNDKSLFRKLANPNKSQWNHAFGTPASTLSAGLTASVDPHSPTIYSSAASSVTNDLPHVQDAMRQQAHLQAQTQHYQLPNTMTTLSQAEMSPTTFVTAPSQSYVSPTMWQDTVANTYVTNDLKRRWDERTSNWPGASDQQQMKRSR